MAAKDSMIEPASGCAGGCLSIGTYILAGLAGLATLIGAIRLGPIDLGRTVYNQVIGDTPALKYQLTDYVRTGIRKKHQALTPSHIEAILADELGVPGAHRDAARVNPEVVSIERLWDAAEEHAKSFYQQ